MKPEQLHFKVTARTLVQLGAELISSDGIAFYELIKNAFDARASRVELEVIRRVPQALLDEAAVQIRRAIQATGAKADWRKSAPHSEGLTESLEAIWTELRKDEEADAEKTIARVSSSKSLARLLSGVIGINHILVKDDGEGMSAEVLRDVFLTIGTPYRALERVAQTAGPPILGEKGLGRLSTMRLGSRLDVETSKTGESTLHTLEIDWDLFAGTTDTTVDTVPVFLNEVTKDTPKDHGTEIRISGLANDWSRERLLDIVEHEFNRLADPFQKGGFPVRARFNREALRIPRFSKLLFEHAHGTIAAAFVAKKDRTAKPGSMSLVASFTYTSPVNRRTYKREIGLSGTHLLSVSEAMSQGVLRALGPWQLALHWFNRQRLQRIEGIGELRQVRHLIKEWAGGVMVFRDGFRVNPYGGGDDDWLSVDRDAFGSAGFKLNRNQLIGKLDITRRDNPRLVDQTSREGLRETPEKVALIAILRYTLNQFRSFVNEIDKQVKAAGNPTIQDVQVRLASQQGRLEEAWEEIREAVPSLRDNNSAIVALRDVVDEITSLVEDSEKVAAAYERGHGELIHLASVGLTVDIIAHELTRATQGALSLVSDAQKGKVAMPGPKGAFAVLEAQLKTLARRLRVLDPLSTSGRQRKETFELASWVRTILEYHTAQFERHQIHCQFRVKPSSSGTYRVHMVKGMVVQILENLISNSVYWLDKKAIESRKQPFEKEILIELVPEDGELRFSDNGPGIEQSRGEMIFIPFNSTKPTRVGRGLGLYVSREVAEYNGASLTLDPQAAKSGMLHTFVFGLPEQSQ